MLNKNLLVSVYYYCFLLDTRISVTPAPAYRSAFFSLFGFPQQNNLLYFIFPAEKSPVLQPPISRQTMKDFYRSFLGIPVAGATLPVIAVQCIAIYGGKALSCIFSCFLYESRLGVGESQDYVAFLHTCFFQASKQGLKCLLGIFAFGLWCGLSLWQ